MNNKIITIAVAILFLVSTITVLFTTGSALGEVFKTYVFKVERCSFKEVPILEPEEPRKIPEEECKLDYNNAKRVLSESLALLIISIPLSIFTYKKLMSLREK